MSAWPPRDDADRGPGEALLAARDAADRALAPGHRHAAVRRTRPSAERRRYGYGLGIRQTCDFRTIVAHSGGLPGFGSQMRWLPDEGVGFIAMGNLTYTGWGTVLDAGHRRSCAKAGALDRGRSQPSAGARARRKAMCRACRDAGTTGSPIASRRSTCSSTSRRTGGAGRSTALRERWARAGPTAASTSRTRCAVSGR